MPIFVGGKSEIRTFLEMTRYTDVQLREVEIPVPVERDSSLLKAHAPETIAQARQAG